MTGWDLVLPPSRPSQIELIRIAATVRVLDRKLPVAVLGSTPEFRDVLHELGFKHVFVLEKNMDFYSAVAGQRIFPAAETVVEGDWLETLPQLHGHFGVILSDLTAGNIPYEARSAFYGAVADALAPSGLFIDKHLTNPDGLLSLDEIEASYRWAPLNLQVANYFSCEAIFCSELQAELGVVDTTVIYDRLAQRLSGERFSRLLAACEAITPSGCRWYYGRPWPELAPTYCAAMELVARHDLTRSEPYFGRAHQYIWTRP